MCPINCLFDLYVYLFLEIWPNWFYLYPFVLALWDFYYMYLFFQDIEDDFNRLVIF